MPISRIELLATIDFPKDGPALKLIADDYRADSVAKWRIRVYRDVQRAPTPSVYHFFEVSFRAKLSAAAFPDVVTYLATRVDTNDAKKTITDAFKQDAAAISVIERR